MSSSRYDSKVWLTGTATFVVYVFTFFFFFSFYCVGQCKVGLTWLLKYEPELFPGLIYRMINPKVVLLIFVSGKIVLTGAKEREQIYEAFENMYPVLGEFKKITLTG